MRIQNNFLSGKMNLVSRTKVRILSRSSFPKLSRLTSSLWSRNTQEFCFCKWNLTCKLAMRGRKLEVQLAQHRFVQLFSSLFSFWTFHYKRKTCLGTSVESFIGLRGKSCLCSGSLGSACKLWSEVCFWELRYRSFWLCILAYWRFIVRCRGRLWF